MCTVTLMKTKSGLLLNMNRDESWLRHEGGVKRQTVQSPTSEYSGENTGIDESLELIYPIDELSGGTWCGYNSQGVAMAILNRYQNVNVKCPSEQLVSRGKIIPAALQAGEISQVIDYVCDIETICYQPFDLVVAGIEKSPQTGKKPAIAGGNIDSAIKSAIISWNGETKSVRHSLISPQNPFWMTTSSSLETKKVCSYRQKMFDRYCLNNDFQPEAGSLPAFHLQQSENAEYSTFMRRKVSHSKSLMQVFIPFDDAEKVQGYYCPEGYLLKHTPVFNKAFSMHAFLISPNSTENLPKNETYA